eukprot:scaffold213_cov245-Pinguiococcus_pyrenoidosus.AAC.43
MSIQSIPQSLKPSSPQALKPSTREIMITRQPRKVDRDSLRTEAKEGFQDQHSYFIPMESAT